MAELILYVAGGSARAQRAESQVRAIIDAAGSNVRLEVVDVRADPARAEEAGILATPTLVRTDGPPSRRVIGDLADRDRVLAFLGFEGVRA